MPCTFLEISIPKKEGRFWSSLEMQAKGEAEEKNLTGTVLVSTQNQDYILKRLKERIFTIVHSAEKQLSPCEFPQGKARDNFTLVVTLLNKHLGILNIKLMCLKIVRISLS